MREQPEEERRSPDASVIAAGVLALLVLVFMLENTTNTRIRFIVPRVDCPLWVALTASFALGIVVGWLLGRRNHKD